MSKDFDERYTDAEGTPQDIVIGTGELAVPLSSIKKAIGGGGGEPVDYALQSDLDETNQNVLDLSGEVDTVKQSVSDGKNLVGNAITGKGGTVTDSTGTGVPAFLDLVEGVEGIATGGLTLSNTDEGSLRRYSTKNYGATRNGNIYMSVSNINTSARTFTIYNQTLNDTIIKTIPMDLSASYSIIYNNVYFSNGYFGIVVRQSTNPPKLLIYDENGTLIREVIIHIDLVTIAGQDENQISFNSNAVTALNKSNGIAYIYNNNGTILVSEAVAHHVAFPVSDIQFIYIRDGSFIAWAWYNGTNWAFNKNTLTTNYQTIITLLKLIQSDKTKLI